MRILVDYRPALRSRTGVGEYVHQIVQAYTRMHDDPVAVFTSSWSDRPHPAVQADLRAYVVDRRIPVRVLNLLWHRLGWPPVEWLAGAVDVVHSLHPLLIPSRRAARVITIHDLFFLTHPERTRAEIRRDYPALAGRHARRADAIVAPSHYTKQLIAERFDVPPERIYVCSPGPPQWRKLGYRPNVPSDGYILFVGTLEPRKNIGTLLDAYTQLRQRLPSAPRLVLAGRASTDAQEWLDRIGRPPLQGHVDLLGYVTDQQREGVYAGARVLVLPSWDEGFGLPALEAMSAGVPVVASTRGSLPEVVGEAGTLVEPGDADGFAAALERLCTDTALAEAHGRAGLQRARAFRWEQGAATLRHAYLDAVARRAGGRA
jgi:glycosyltransferase involved in cell wall biosynthesis